MKSKQCNQTVNKEINILMERCHNMKHLQNSIHFCRNGRRVQGAAKKPQCQCMVPNWKAMAPKGHAPPDLHAYRPI
ncbi:hypothetical protein E2C01_007899 [Portunus trituberculatus]|uniref:Uncharacterized protein n=1 Tax=Portunus trituberculatus TaxID=210409 RepID=A0A5B7D3L1_PORTR|nr:hypothetical protein [Portunus trituberculatus]